MVPRIAALALALAVPLAGGCSNKKSGQPAEIEPPVDGDFTVVLIPDTQYYVGPNAHLFQEQIQWIADNKDARNIVFAIHLGDMTNNNSPGEWKKVDRFMRPLEQAGVPYSVLPGNHDGVHRGKVFSTLYNQTFGVARFAGKPWYGGHYGDTNDNNYTFFEAGGMEFMVLSLSFGTPQEYIDWADEILAKYPNKRVIFATHSYLDDDGTYLERGEEYAVEHERWRDGAKVWAMLKKHPNVFMTVCGHVPDQGYRRSTNDAGKTVHEILANYQGNKNGGNGYLRLLRFSPSRDKIYVEAYSPPLDKYWRDPKHEMVLDYPMPD
jgi:3',5'-cyclic AMP phosphodiesterase CpdA